MHRIARRVRRSGESGNHRRSVFRNRRHPTPSVEVVTAASVAVEDAHDLARPLCGADCMRQSGGGPVMRCRTTGKPGSALIDHRINPWVPSIIGLEITSSVFVSTS
jgi:hypothetical protein